MMEMMQRLNKATKIDDRRDKDKKKNKTKSGLPKWKVDSAVGNPGGKRSGRNISKIRANKFKKKTRVKIHTSGFVWV